MLFTQMRPIGGEGGAEEEDVRAAAAMDAVMEATAQAKREAEEAERAAASVQSDPPSNSDRHSTLI